jgi:outer membrane lipoprotein carrier protein
MRILKFELIIAIVLIAASALADGSPHIQTLVARLQQHYQATKTFSADFKEDVTPAGGMKRERQGTVYFEKPGKMRWEFSGDDKEIIVSDGKTIYNFQPDLNQVIETPLDQAFRSASAAAFLLGAGRLEQDFDASIPSNPPDDSLKHVTLKSRKGGDTVDLALDPSTFDIEKFRMTDQLGDVTDLQFSNIKKDVALDDKIFAYSPPPGADIVTSQGHGPQDFK